MLFNYTYRLKELDIKPDCKRALFLAKKMLPEYVFDTAQLEKNPVAFPEVQTLLDGITIGGHKVSDVQQVLNIADIWKMVLSAISSGFFAVSKEWFHKVNTVVAREESLEWGVFRSGQVGIAGTELYQAPEASTPEEIFKRELPLVLDVPNPVEQAIRLFLWGALNQFYWDGNKRTARIMASGLLINAGYGVLNISSKDILEFNTLMVAFYETQKADGIIRFLAEKCIKYVA